MKPGLLRAISPFVALGLGLAFFTPVSAARHSVQGTSSAASTSLPASLTNVASQGWNLVPGAAKSLTLSASYRNTHVHIMPPVQWYEKNSVATNVSGSSASTLPAPTCTLASSTSGTATWEGQSNDAENITAFGLSTSADGKTLTAQIQVKSLSDGPGGTPAISGDGDNWYVTWNYGTYSGINGYFLEASYPGGTGNVDPTSGLPVDFQWGEVQPGTAGATSTTYAPVGAVTGSMDLKSNIITITAPISDFSSTTSAGGPQAFSIGAALKKAASETWASVGAPGVGGLIQPVDTLDTQSADYVVGDAYPNCPGTTVSSGGGGGSTGTAPSVPTAGSHSNLAYYGGPIVHAIHNHVIFWLPQAGTLNGPDGSACPEPATASYNYEPSTPTNQYGPGDASYEQTLKNYFSDLQGTSFYNLLSQYSDQNNGVVPSSVSFAGSWRDPCGYTSTANPTAGPIPGGTPANPVYDLDLQNEVLRAIKINHWQEGLGNQYYVFLGFSAATCFNPNTNSPTANACDIDGVPPAFCAYHGDFTDPNNGNTVLYANMTDGGLETAFACYESPIGGGTSPAHMVNGQPVHDYVADAEVAITSHEEFETVTDAMVGTAATLAPPLGWYDTVAGEIGDKCAYLYGNYGPDGGNITLQNGDRYIVQEEWSNWANGCSLGDPSVASGTYGGASTTVPINQGWNLISLPVSGIDSTWTLAYFMNQQLPTGSLRAIASDEGGIWSVSVPGYNYGYNLNPNDGVYVLNSGPAATWSAPGPQRTSASPINLVPGWNLVSAPWPNPGLTTDSMFNQIESESNACQANAFTNGACNPTVSEIDSYGPTYDNSGNVNGGQFINWKPAAADSAGNATWPQTYGNQIPFTNGVWIKTDRSITWTPQGTECQSISNGVCQ